MPTREAASDTSFFAISSEPRILIHILNGLSDNPMRDYEQIRQELALFDPGLADKPEVVALNKLDLPDVQSRWESWHQDFAERGMELFPISAATSHGVKEVLRRVNALLVTLPPQEQPAEGIAIFEGPPQRKGFPDHAQGRGLVCERCAG